MSAFDISAAEAIIDRAREELAILMGYDLEQFVPSLTTLVTEVIKETRDESFGPVREPVCEKCDGEGWVWDEEEGGSFDCVCADDPAMQSARNQRLHDERHEPDHPLPTRWQDCRRCLSLNAVLS